ncbi:MAG: hypothetical protein Q3976_06080 [Corynebacterium sp.]|nr:hypothetical protein [Corynebacterium sp.]
MNLNEVAGFKNLWVAHTLAVMGTQSGVVIIPLIALQSTGASVFQMGVLEAAQSLAALCFGLLIGSVADFLGAKRP